MIIGLSGYGRSGKNEAANGLISMGFTALAFADKLRECMYALDPYISSHERLSWAVDEFGWDVAKTKFPEIRKLLQRFGTEVGRNLLGQNIWVDSTLTDLNDYNNYVVTDCRFVNEADGIRRSGGKLIRIVRPGVGPVNDHPSETSLDDYPFDALIVNNGGVDSLHSDIRKLVRNAGWV